MAVYQIYKVLFNRSRQGNLLSTMDGRSAYDKAQELLEEMLGGVLPLTKEKRDKTLVPLENYVEKRRDGVTVMVVCNEKNHKYREKLEEHELVYHPGCRVILDNRPGIAQLAIERSQSFDGKTDKVRDIIGVRSFARFESKEDDYNEKILNQFIQYSGRPVFSMEAATRHPLQSFADLITIEEYKKTARPKVVMTWAPHPKSLPQAVPNSFAEWMNATDYEFVITHPEGYELDPKFVELLLGIGGSGSGKSVPVLVAKERSRRSHLQAQRKRAASAGVEWVVDTVAGEGQSQGD